MITDKPIASSDAAADLVSAIARIHSRGWALGTGGNFSAVSNKVPLRLLISRSGVDKGAITESDLVEIDSDVRTLRGVGQPSTEALLHVAIVESLNAGAVLHTHSVWNTTLSVKNKKRGAIRIEGLEMLKGLSGVTTHEHVEEIPIFVNSQDMKSLSREVRHFLNRNAQTHAFLLSGHGLYTWGKDCAEAARHVEVIEFLLEVVARL